MNVSFFPAIGSLLLLAAVTSCGQSESASAPQSGFTMQATKDAAPWAAPATATFSKARKEFYVLGQAGDAAKADVLSLGFALPAWPQPAPVQAVPATWRVLLGFDALTDSYATADAAGLPQVEITRLDTASRVVEGRFRATLLREKQWTPKTETMVLKNGSFRARYTLVP